jgi:hypothetical protein
LLSARSRLGTHPRYSATITAPSAISATPSQLSMVSFSPSKRAEDGDQYDAELVDRGDL